jgi:SP family sugar:H+ symporter-like MFS transporter
MLAVMAIIFSSAGTDAAGDIMLEGNSGLYALLAANAYIAFFAFSWGPVMWGMLGEMFPNHFRGTALAICGVAQWGANFTITMTFPIFLATLGLGFSYGLYAFFGLVAYVFVKKYVIETKGKSLEEMGELLKDNS